MNSFNDIDGIPSTGHKHLQRDVFERHMEVEWTYSFRLGPLLEK